MCSKLSRSSRCWRLWFSLWAAFVTAHLGCDSGDCGDDTESPPCPSPNPSLAPYQLLRPAQFSAPAIAETWPRADAKNLRAQFSKDAKLLTITYEKAGQTFVETWNVKSPPTFADPAPP